MKIKTLTLDNFRGFPYRESISLNGKNLLVYGENGAGKSSLYMALRDLFSIDCPPITEHSNKFRVGQATTVEVEFDDERRAVVWNSENHPGKAVGDRRIAEAALRVASLDYRSLLRTNFIFGNDPLNWFRILSQELLAGYQTPGGPTLHTVWEELDSHVRYAAAGKLTQDRHAYIIESCQEFTNLFRLAIEALRPELPPILNKLSDASLHITLPDYQGLTYRAGNPKRNRGLIGEEYTPEIKFLNLPPLERPQAFLNEARQSAIGLAIYLAGRKAVVPTNQEGVLRLLVLDDVLIGLDHSHRLPLLEMLTESFRDWQVVLLTYDRVWYEMARLMLHQSKWGTVEIFEGTCPIDKHPMPLIRHVDKDIAIATLNQAKVFLIGLSLRLRHRRE